MLGKKKMNIQKIAKEIKNKNVLVIGDAILDIAIFCDAVGLSLETPTLKADKKSSTFLMGGAANVANNCANLGIKTYFLTVLGNDEFYPKYKSWFCNNLQFYPALEKRDNITKSRYWVARGDANYKAFQLNTGDKKGITKKSKKYILKKAKEILPFCDAMILADYQNGVFKDQAFIDDLINLSKTYEVLSICNSQKSSNKFAIENFSKADLVTMNKEEALSLEIYLDKDLNLKNFSNVCITLGSKGAVLKSDKIYSHPGYRIKTSDACGAGDSFLACLSALDWKKYPKKSLQISNAWAALYIKNNRICSNLDKLIEFISKK